MKKTNKAITTLEMNHKIKFEEKVLELAESYNYLGAFIEESKTTDGKINKRIGRRIYR